MTGRTLRLTPYEQVTVRAHTPEVLDVEVRYAVGGDRPPKHLHPEQDEHFAILAGRLGVEVGGDRRELGPGDELDVPRGTAHRMWNAGDEEVVATWQTMPTGRTLEWFETLDALEHPTAPAFAVRLRRYPDVFRLAGPAFIVGPFVALLAAVGRLRERDGSSAEPATGAR